MGILSIKFSLSLAAKRNEWAAELHSLGCCPFSEGRATRCSVSTVNTVPEITGHLSTSDHGLCIVNIFTLL